ncbi:neprosin family prolyl endopeptidase [Chitinophaga sp.]|uniref:neprosin family prolyl endopeptidase n=1 Tax=Chitinophaga sp. TaxID=1869181 RepID=UPI0031CF3847
MSQSPFPPFKEFITSLRSGNKQFGVYNQRRDLSIIKKYIIDLYDGTSAVHSFQDEYGQVWDCIPFDEQPTLNKYQLKLAEPADMEWSGQNEESDEERITSNYNNQKVDPYGNKMQCPVGTIPMKRVRVEDVAAAGNLKSFLRKKSIRFGKSQKVAAFNKGHEYALGAQRVENRGGISFLNIWQPTVEPGQYFSLSQIWVSGITANNRQIVECGWQVAPQLYHDGRPNLFVFWTPDDYKTGYYNLTGPGFVQTNSNWMVGYPFAYISRPNAQQYDISMAWYQRPDGNWWLYINGSKKADAVGYYPAEIFNNGQLTRFANDIKFGGEVSGETSLPPMGSGQRAAFGFKRAAYQRNVEIFTLDREPQGARITALTSMPDRYSIEIGTDPNWGTFFYFGGA